MTTYIISLAILIGINAILAVTLNFIASVPVIATTLGAWA